MHAPRTRHPATPPLQAAVRTPPRPRARRSPSRRAVRPRVGCVPAGEAAVALPKTILALRLLPAPSSALSASHTFWICASVCPRASMRARKSSHDTLPNRSTSMAARIIAASTSGARDAYEARACSRSAADAHRLAPTSSSSSPWPRKSTQPPSQNEAARRRAERSSRRISIAKGVDGPAPRPLSVTRSQ